MMLPSAIVVGAAAFAAISREMAGQGAASAEVAPPSGFEPGGLVSPLLTPGVAHTPVCDAAALSPSPLA